MLTPWVLRIIIANVIVFVLTSLRESLVVILAFVPLQFFAEPWTVVTYMFVHDTSNIGHILFNMLALFFFGPRLEMELGSKHFLGLYIVSGLMGALLSLIFNPLSPIIGASGAVYGVMIGYASFWPRDKVYVWGVLPVEVRIMVAVMTALSLFGGFGAVSDGVAHFAHLGGFAGGILYVRVLRHSSRLRRMQQQLVDPISHLADVQRWKTIPRERLHEVNREEYDRIMAKLGTSGVSSLSEAEKSFLNRFSE